MGLLDLIGHKYPFTDFHDLNLDWCITAILQLQKAFEDFSAGNKIVFANPLQHDLTKTYAKNTIVVDSVSGTAYLSLDAVPVGVQLDNADYWLPVFDFAGYVTRANQNFTANYFSGTVRTPYALVVGDWVVLDDVLYKVTTAMAADDLFIIGTNIIHFTVEQFLKDFVTSINQTVLQYKNDIDASEYAYRQQLAQDIADTTASLQAQLDLAISGATVDSEVINARLGADGVTYPTLGDAIRTQVTDVTRMSQTVGYTQGGIIRDGTCQNPGNANAVTIGIFDIKKYDHRYSCYRIKTSRPVDTGYEYYYVYAYTNVSTGYPDPATITTAIGDITTTTRKLDEPFYIDTGVDIGLMFSIVQKDSNGVFSPLRATDFYDNMLTFEPVDIHTVYSIRPGSYGNAGNTNYVTAGIYPVTPGKQVRLHTDKPIQVSGNYYKFGYYFISNESNNKYLQASYYNSYIVAQKDISSGVTSDNAVEVPAGAIGLIITIGEFTSSNVADPVAVDDFAGYNIYVEELNSCIVGGMRDGSYGNIGNPNVVSTGWIPVEAGTKLRLKVNRPLDPGYYYRIGCTFSSTYRSGFTYDASAFGTRAYDSPTWGLIENDILDVPAGAIAVCFTIDEFDGVNHRPLRVFDFYPYYSVDFEVIKAQYPGYFNTAFATAAASIESYLNEGHDVATFAFVTDTHIGANRKHSVELIKAMCELCNIPVVIHGGDAVTGLSIITEDDLIQEIKDSDKYFKPIEDMLYQVIGNHDPVYGTSNYEKNLTDGSEYNNYFRHNEKKVNLHYGPDNTYFYVDNDAQKVRYIFLNFIGYNSQIDANGDVVAGGANKLTTFALGNTQMNWLIDTLAAANGYDIVITSHSPMVYTSDLTAIDAEFSVEPQYVDIDIITNVLNAFTNKSTFYYDTYLTIGTVSEHYLVNCDFTASTSDLMCCISGHTHHDLMIQKYDVMHVNTANDSWTVAATAATYAPPKTLSTDSEQIIDFFCLDKTTKTGYVVRLGAYTSYFGKVRTFTW